MKQKTKKRMIGVAIIIVWLVGCYFIGQATHPKGNIVLATASTDTTPEKNDSGKTASQKIPGNKEKENVTNKVTVSFLNVKQLSTDEIPWGVNAGTISLEDGSEAWLLTPGTSLSCESESRITLECRIHPWMKDVSDGAVMSVSSDKDSETVNIGNTPQEISVGPGRIGLELQNTDSDDGDWVIIQKKTDD